MGRTQAQPAASVVQVPTGANAPIPEPLNGREPARVLVGGAVDRLGLIPRSVEALAALPIQAAPVRLAAGVEDEVAVPTLPYPAIAIEGTTTAPTALV